LPTLSVTCSSDEIDTCTSANSSRSALLALKTRFDGYSCKDIYSLYPTNFNNYFEYNIRVQVFTNTEGLFGQSFDWLDQNQETISVAAPDTEYTLCGFIDYNSDSMLSSGEPFYEKVFNFNFDPYPVDEWSKNQ
ncbi:MAG: hypothetical protein MK008_14920, partial [Bdellovibrionales bacterium]|nr:hypothetical protein [Bdellovibrionales bacterium]